MEKIICFGDSNTFGFNPTDGSRYGTNQRWTALLAENLGEHFSVAEEGCNNRTGFFVNPDGYLQSTQKYLPECLDKHDDFSIFVLAIGTNDLQRFFNINKNIVEVGLKSIINLIRERNPKSRIIIITPVKLCEDVLKGCFNYQFNADSICSSVWIQDVYKYVANQENCELFDLNEYVSPSELDGLHFDPDSHRIIADRLACLIDEKLIKSDTRTSATC